jgi:hypothetical protein
MDYRILVAATLGLMLAAFGGFYYAFAPRSQEETLSAPSTPVVAAGAPAGKATPASIEAELMRSQHAELADLLKRHFAEDYNELIANAVRARNEGASDAALGQEIAARVQQTMRGKLKFAVAADTPVIDRLAANELVLFHALGTDASAFCLKVLGKDNTPDNRPLPEQIQRLLRLGNLYRFQAIVDGMPRFRPIEPLSAGEAATLDAALGRVGMRLDEVRSGAFLNQDGGEPGKPCLMIEKLYRTIAGLGDETRRKLYAGMFFLDRDK